MKTFYTRTLSAAVFVVVMLLAILWTPGSFFLLFLLLALGGTREYFRLITQIDPDYAHLSSWHRPCIYLLVIAIFLMLSGDFFTFLYLPAVFLGLWMGILVVIILMINEGLFMDHLRPRNLKYSLLGLLYVALPLALMVRLRLYHSWHGYPVIPLGLIFCIWINDTMAYITGSLIGKTKFFPAISPKKTWEGTLGGVFFTLVAACIYGYLGHTYRLVDWVVIALIASVVGTAGDLLESRIKRMAGVKDSGHLMPGHGGILDRFDSLLAATPLVWLYAFLFIH
jgi:phosphatidate cytidylyltransferase